MYGMLYFLTSRSNHYPHRIWLLTFSISQYIVNQTRKQEHSHIKEERLGIRSVSASRNSAERLTYCCHRHTFCNCHQEYKHHDIFSCSLCDVINSTQAKNQWEGYICLYVWYTSNAIWTHCSYCKINTKQKTLHTEQKDCPTSSWCSCCNPHTNNYK
jgi:hypothetical protein